MPHRDSPQTSAPLGDITALLRQISEGNEDARDELFARVYPELRTLAQIQLARHPGGSRNATSLVHESYFDLVHSLSNGLESRRHLFGIAMQAMKDSVIDDARRRLARKRGGDRQHTSLSNQDIAEREACDQTLELARAFERLKHTDAVAAEIAMLRVWGGLTHEQIVDVLNLTVATIRRRWAYAQAFLRDAMTSPDDSDPANPVIRAQASQE